MFEGETHHFIKANSKAFNLVSLCLTSVLFTSFPLPCLPDPISVQPASQNKPLAHQPFSLQCVGSQNPASILWFKNGLPIAVSGRVSLSPNNITMSFSPLLQSDGGLYQCIVSQGGAPIKGVGYQLNVNCEYAEMNSIYTVIFAHHTPVFQERS